MLFTLLLLSSPLIYSQSNLVDKYSFEISDYSSNESEEDRMRNGKTVLFEI
jgi:hypothetical protein